MALLVENFDERIPDASRLRPLAPKDISEPRLALALRPSVHPVGESPLPSAGSGNGPDFIFLDLKQASEQLET